MPKCRIRSRSSKDRERESAVQYKFYIQLCFAMFCMYLVFIVGIDRTQHYAGCVSVSVLIQYFILVSVMWMTAICMFLFWMMVVNPFAKSKFNSWHMLLITVLCWGKYKMLWLQLCYAYQKSLLVASTLKYLVQQKNAQIFLPFKCSCSLGSGYHSIGYRQRLGHCS